jgi:hypothetical protein
LGLFGQRNQQKKKKAAPNRRPTPHTGSHRISVVPQPPSGAASGNTGSVLRRLRRAPRASLRPPPRATAGCRRRSPHRILREEDRSRRPKSTRRSRCRPCSRLRANRRRIADRWPPKCEIGCALGLRRTST